MNSHGTYLPLIGNPAVSPNMDNPRLSPLLAKSRLSKLPIILPLPSGMLACPGRPSALWIRYLIGLVSNSDQLLVLNHIDKVNILASSHVQINYQSRAIKCLFYLLNPGMTTSQTSI